MECNEEKQVDCLVVDTTAFIQNAALQNVANNVVTCQDVVDEITNKRQLRRLVVLPYDLIIKDVFPENIKIVTDFAKKTGDYASLSATDIKVIALTYQLEKEKVGINHLRTEPVMQRNVVTEQQSVLDMNPDISGFYLPGGSDKDSNLTDDDKDGDGTMEEEEIENNLTDDDKNSEKLSEKFSHLDFNEDEILVPVRLQENDDVDEGFDDDEGWITPSNVKEAKKQVNSELMEEKHVAVACMTTDFAMQNVLKQMNLNVSALDGRMIKQLRTFILRCYSCFKTTSMMTKKFCPKCGNDTLKKVAVSLDENGQQHIHINAKRPLTGRGKTFSLPKFKGGKHPNNPIIVADQPLPDNRPSRLARMKNNPMDEDYIAGYSPFVMRDVNSKSAQLGVRPGSEFKYWMRKNPNEARRRRK